MLLCSSIYVFATTEGVVNDSIGEQLDSLKFKDEVKKNPYNLTTKDSLFLEYMDVFMSQLREPEYKLYPTTNMWTFLKLNTTTGQIWQVQWSLEDNKRFEYVLDRKSRLNSWDERICGRFELHPTQNRNTFILLDNIDGRCWQVQWSIDDDERFVLPIW